MLIGDIAAIDRKISADDDSRFETDVEPLIEGLPSTRDDLNKLFSATSIRRGIAFCLSYFIAFTHAKLASTPTPPHATAAKLLKRFNQSQSFHCEIGVETENCTGEVFSVELR